MKTSWWTLTVSALLLACMTASADDGEKTLKMMSRNAKVTVEPADVGLTVSESEHAFIDMMKFHVPAQAASGDTSLPIDYYNIDEALVESLGVAKPLVAVFIHGPAIGVDGVPFAHSFMDAFAAVSLDDGLHWKATNLSQSADQSSFQLGQSGGGQHANDHDAHEDEDDGDDHHQTIVGPTIYFAEWSDKSDGTLKAKGNDAPAKALVSIINAYSKDVVGTVIASSSGNWEIKVKGVGEAPCVIAAVADGIEGPRIVPENTPEECDGGHILDYPGGVHNVFHATAGNKVLVAWPSRYCKQGQPAYSLKNDPDELDAIVSFIQTGATGDGSLVPALGGFSLEDDLYLVDAFGVAGSQKSSDFADEGYPQVGEVPFGCVWTARGVLLPGDDPRTDLVEATHMVWTKAERLTSGRRDPFRIEVKAVKGDPYAGRMSGGFVVTWQEDPEGLRPGQGLGPGEGWSGAVAHHKTDVWYSFINWEYFDLVENLDEVNGAPINIVNHDLLDSGTPKAFIPMAMPMRLTNNDKCKVDEESGELVDTSLYCHPDPYDFGDGILVSATDYGIKNQCMDTVDIPTGPNDDLKPICVSEDGLPNIANTGSTRPRTSLQKSESGSAWVVVAAEESKGLGAFFYYPDGSECVEDREDPLCQEEIGKNQWYFSFDMGTPDTSADVSDTGLVKNLVSQGNMLNQPEVYWETGEFLPLMDTSAMWGFPDYNFQIYNTEIARRSSLLVQSTAKANASDSGLLAISSWKQGPMRQGGPADTMLRRIVDQGTSLNPYAFTNVVCGNWAFRDGSNPYYPDGVCLDPATNLSSVVPDTCTDTSTGGDIPCPTVTFDGSTFGRGDTNPILQGYTQHEGNTQKVLTWHQCPSDGTQKAGDITAITCENDNRTDGYVNLQDQSWYNPLDVSKGHRGFLDGDMVMFMYAWSPNWRLNAKGSDRYDLYVRRSFDGGATWTTTPESGTASDGITAFDGDGTVTCETYRSLETQSSGDVPEPQVCYDYPKMALGAAEQARNVTQHSRMRVTTLDPRYASTPASIEFDCVDSLDPTVDISVMTCDDGSTEHDSDLRDPSRFFMVFETGDNRTVEEGEAEPLDLFYSRAINFGDDYVVWTDEILDSALTECYPSDSHGDEKVIGTPAEGSAFCNEFDRMNASGDTHSSEASLEANPDGSKMYGVWTQWVFDEYGEEVTESDAMARRIWWIDNYISPNPDLVWTLPGTNQP